MRLITKINIYFAIILAVLMLAVFSFTLHFFHKELEAQMEDSLQVTHTSFKITTANLISEQKTKATSCAKRDVILIATKDRICSVLHYYLKIAAADFSIDLMEVLDREGNLLADTTQSYEFFPATGAKRKPKRLPTSGSYLTQRNKQVYLLTSTPIIYANETVGYLNLGTGVNHKLVGYLASILHSEVAFYANGKQLVGTAGLKTLSAPVLEKLRRNPGKSFFLPGNQGGTGDFDYILFTLPTDKDFTGSVALAKSRAAVNSALLRHKLFLLGLTGFGLAFSIIGTHFLTRNIKKSIFGMEPQEIASILDQRTAILQSTFEGIIALDRTGRIMLINKEAQHFLPSACEPVGQPAIDFFDNLQIQEVLQTGQAIYNQQQAIGESTIVYNCVPIRTNNRTLGAVITLRDLTEFQKVAAELMEVKNYTQALRAQSHEFMNKMQSVSGLIQLGRYETALTLLHETSESHQEIISYLVRAFSHSAVSGILLGKFNRAKELNIQFKIDHTSFIPREAHVPDHELVCIVGNLIENAFEALENQPQTLKTVTVRLRPVNRQLQITVVDNGPGIPPTIRNLIFNRGFTSKKGQNKGIGLCLVKQCVETLRGSIRFHSHPSRTVFWVKIPLRERRTTFEANQSVNCRG